MSGMQNDFIGFTFNGIHSSELGIVRTSEGSRFNENLLPTIQDKTVQIPGGDGTYFFGSYYTQKVFSVSFAFDNLSETQFRKIRSVFGDKKIHPLVFDELPYKVYQAKVTGSATIKHICFEESRNNKIERIYRGEGTVQFTAYNPFARSPKKFLKDYTDPNKDEWAAASGMRTNGYYNEASSSQGKLDIFNSTNNSFFVYNPGDLPTDFIIQMDFKNGAIPSGSIYFKDGDERLQFSAMAARGVDAGVQINSKMNLIEGVNSAGVKTGNLYNDAITAGAFFKIPQTGIGTDGETVATLFLDLANGAGATHNPKIMYDYIYF